MSTINRINVDNINYDIKDTWRPVTVGNTTISDNSDAITIVGSGATSVSLNANTHTLTISSTDNNTTYSVANNSPLSMTGTVIDISVGDGANQVAAGIHTHTKSEITDFPTLATVATSGSYNDLENKPTIPAAYSLPAATANVLGGVTIGNNISVSSGKISVGTASTSSFGVVKIGSGINVTNGVISVSGSGGGGGGDYGTTVVTKDNKTSLQAVTNLNPDYAGSTRGNGAVDLQQFRSTNTNVASGDYSVIMGYNNNAIGYYSVAMGNTNRASNNSSVAMGQNNNASGYYSVAMGYNNSASSNSSVAIGYHSTASGYSSVVTGYHNTASGNYSVAMGCDSTASGYSSVAIGCGNTTGADNSFIGGGSDNVIVRSAEYSFIGGGKWNTTKGKYSATISGTHNRATHDFSVACGEYCRNLFPSTAVNHLEPKKTLPEGIFGHSGKFSLTVQGNREAKIFDFTKCIFSGILNVHQIIYTTDGTVQFLERVVYIRDNEIIKNELIRDHIDHPYPDWSSGDICTLFIKNRILYCSEVPSYMYGVDMMQIGIDYTCLGEQTGGGDYYYGSY